VMQRQGRSLGPGRVPPPRDGPTRGPFLELSGRLRGFQGPSAEYADQGSPRRFMRSQIVSVSTPERERARGDQPRALPGQSRLGRDL